MNKFIAKLQESTEFDTTKRKNETTKGKGSKDKKNDEAGGDQDSPGAVAMYQQFLEELIKEILDNSVLTQQNANFQLKTHW